MNQERRHEARQRSLAGTERLMKALLQQPPKPHEKMKLGTKIKSQEKPKRKIAKAT